MNTQTQLEYKTPAQITDVSADPQAVSPANLVGTWNNIDHATRNIVKVVITAAGAGVSVHGFGACTPTPCDWGAVSGLAYSANVSSTAAVAFTAQFRFSFSQVTLVGHLQGRQLLVESFTHFTDGSGRNDYYSTDVMSH